jgi:nucleotide-binding universal stress UspA family protein
MFRKILVPLDGSENAERGLPWVRRYAAPSNTPVVLVRVLSKVYPLEGMPFGALAKEASDYLQGVQKRLLAEGIPTKIHLPQNAAAESIVKAADQENCGLIVMTTRGASKVVRWLIGGVTEQVLRTSPIPVLVIRSQASPPTEANPRRILVPQDGSARARRALGWAERLALFHDVPMEILHVQPQHSHPFRKAPSPRAQVSRKLAHWCSLLRRRGVAATYLLTQGDPASEILRNTSPTDLLVMTTHGYGGLKHLILGSVAEKVIHGTEAPIFFFKRRSSRAPKKSSLIAEDNVSHDGNRLRRSGR